MSEESICITLIFALCGGVIFKAGYTWKDCKTPERGVWLLAGAAYIYVIYTFFDNLLKR